MPRLTVSSIAWKLSQQDEVARSLKKHGANAIEASPGLFSLPLHKVTPQQAREVRSFWEAHSLPIVAMQALLFNGPQVNLFESASSRQILLEYLKRVIGIAAQLGCGPLVFGSPKNRLVTTQSPDQAFDLACDFFGSLAQTAEDEGCVFCIEANAADYGCNFITTHKDAINLAKAVNKKGLGFNLDTGVMQMNGESVADIEELLLTGNVCPAHIHISQPFLEPVVKVDPELHGSLRLLLEKIAYPGNISIEMKNPATEEDTVTRLTLALNELTAIYGKAAHATT